MELLNTPWKTVEDNTKESFRVAKNDIIGFGIQLAKVQHSQRALEHELHQQRETSTGHVDFSGIYARTDALRNEIDTLRSSQLEQQRIDEELVLLRKRYDNLVNVTKSLVAVLEAHIKKGDVKIVRKTITKVVKQKPTVKVVRRVKVIRTIVKVQPKRRFIASKATMRVHDTHCPFSRNVKRKNKLVFKTRMTAFKRGYRACKCLR